MDSRIVLLSIMLVVLLWNCRDSIENFISRENVCNNIDGRCYSIVKNFPPHTHERASEVLAKTNRFAISLMKHMRNKHLWNKSNNHHRRDMTAFLLENYNPDKIVENAPSDPTNTSFVEDKGHTKFALCLRNYINGDSNFLPDHIVEFVTIHEMAHMSTRSYGHEQDFWINFKILLQEAKEAGIHEPINYKKTPTNYCSLRVDYSPYYDNALPVM